MFPSRIWAPLVLPILLGGHHRKILPCSIDGPFKKTIMSLFQLAWSSKLRLPLLITVAFLAFDVHVQMEINVFWEAEDRVEERRRRQLTGTDNAVRLQVNPRTAPLAQMEEFDDVDSDSDWVSSSETEYEYDQEDNGGTNDSELGGRLDNPLLHF